MAPTNQKSFQPYCEDSQMHSSLTAIVLCIFAQTVAAQCVDTAPLAQAARSGSAMINTSKVMAPAAARFGGELITTAAAGTHDAARRTHETPQAARSTPTAPANEDDRPRSGTAMLLAAVALMSGIALRRYSAHKQ